MREIFRRDGQRGLSHGWHFASLQQDGARRGMDVKTVRGWIGAVAALVVVAGLSACAPVMPVGTAPVVAMPEPDGAVPERLQPRDAARNFIEVVERVEPMAEALCRARNPGVNCDFLIVIDEHEGKLRTLAFIVPQEAPPDAEYTTVSDSAPRTISVTINGPSRRRK